MKGFYQVVSTKNDVNGNPRRLVLVYNKDAEIETVVRSGSSRPNVVHSLNKNGYASIFTVSVTPSVFTGMTKDFKEILQHE